MIRVLSLSLYHYKYATFLNLIKEFFFLFKIHHWIKNLIIFLPIVVTHSYNDIFLYEAIFYFFYFSITTSLAYLLNNINDYNIDLENGKAKYSVNLKKKNFYYLSIFIIISIQSTSIFFINYKIFLICFLYLLLAILYNLLLKKIKFLDILILVLFHFIRIIYGSYIFNIDLKFYFTSFCLLIFLMIGSNKRLTELNLNLKGKPYTFKDIYLLKYIQNLSCLFALLIFLFYSFENSSNIPILNSFLIYFNFFLITLLVLNFLYFKDKSQSDIIIFILKDKINFFLTISFFGSFFLNSFLLYN